MYLLLMLWVVIDMVLFILLLFRPKMAKDENVLYTRSIGNINSLSIRLFDWLVTGLWLILAGIIIFALVCIMVTDETISKILKWHTEVFILAWFPLLWAQLKEEKYHIKTIWAGVLTVSTVLLSLAGYIDIAEKQDKVFISTRNGILRILMTLLIISFFCVMHELQKKSKGYYSSKIDKKGIRKDLYYRTPGLMLNVSDVELIKCCERYFSEYIFCFNRIKELRTIEYVNLVGAHRELWYKKTALFMKIFWTISALIAIIKMFFGMTMIQVLIPVSLIFFVILVAKYKHVDPEYFYKLAIRYFYDEWGYYLTYPCRGKFVGTVQLFEWSESHRYIHSFLDIVALCRAVAFSDKMNGDNKICIITSNLSDLFLKHSDYKDSKNWVTVIPLWAAALFEFSVTGRISDNVKDVLMKAVREDTRADIGIFLQSFWADVERKELKDGVANYIQLFKDKVYA